ncbi:hypothetical protein CBER1_09824 [Cercospora berteroae]|uniref:Piwi domain-containing protein n=1 Tax=Cercospora berteroae TaxID=357750 RepID=A0A2S6BX37_9PEZI|nr:hypothetical protein CBER1_09824 [Cercospora berteroae]
MVDRIVPVMAPAKQASLSVYAKRFAPRCAASTEGAPVTLRVNFFAVRLPEVEHVWHYSIVITRADNGEEVKVAGLKKDLIRDLLSLPFFDERDGQFATDYRSSLIFLTRQDQIIKQTMAFAPVAGSSAQKFNVTLNGKHRLAMSDLDEYLNRREQRDCLVGMTALNVLSRTLAAPKAVKFGRIKFFPTKMGDVTWAKSLNFRNGFFTSMRPVDGQVVTNIHGVSCAFVVEQQLHHYAPKGLRVRLLYIPPTAANAARSKISSIPVKNSQIRRINGFGQSAAEQTFEHTTHGQITVQKYFNQYVLKPGSVLEYPSLLTCDLGTHDHPCFVPAELLYIAPDQPFLGKLPDKAMPDMINASQRLPLTNVAVVEDCLQPDRLFDSQKIQSSLDKGISVQLKMKETEARMIEIPDLVYNRKVQPGSATDDKLRSGKWDLRGKSFQKSGIITVLGIIGIGGASTQINDYRPLATALRRCGLNGKVEVHVARSATVARDDLSAAASELADAKFLLIVLPEKSAEAYERVKWWADVVTGVHTVCITPQNVKNLVKPPFQANLALKFNAKAGGFNHTLPESELKLMRSGVTMAVGADVTHPGPGSVPHCPSIAAVVASDDKHAVNYPGSLPLQRCKQESIEDLDSMIVERLEVWVRKNKSPPENILFYRDGVSESQFAMAKNQELPKVVEACKDYASTHPKFSSFNPKITLVVCGKRHHTRFYPPAEIDQSVKWALDDNNNFRPGLVVDDPSIRNPFHFDFYLQSHAALEGTARPCHYFVIRNDMGLSASALQRITFNMCWTFARALTPISYATSAYYADRLAERGRCYLAPFMAPSHVARPTEQQLFEGLKNVKKATMEEKDLHVLQKIKGGFSPQDGFPAWTCGNRLNPFKDAVAGTMFYI